MGRYRTKVDLNSEDKSVDVETIDKEDKDKVVAKQSFSALEIHESLRGTTALYGYSKLLQDRTSEMSDQSDRIVGMQAVAAQLAAGEWAKARKVGAIQVSPFVEALAQIKKCTVGQIQAALKKFPKDARDHILGNDKVVELGNKIKAEREGAEVNLTDLAPAAA